MRGSNIDEKTKQKALTMLAVTSAAEVSRKMGIPESTLKQWRADQDDFGELRRKFKEQFTRDSMRVIGKALTAIEHKLEDPEQAAKMPAQAAANVINVLFNKQALAQGEATENVNMTVTKFEDLEE